MPERPYSILHVEDNARLREQMALILKSYQIAGSPTVSEGLFAAYRAFSEAGGGRADFYHWWREMYADALNKPV